MNKLSLVDLQNHINPNQDIFIQGIGFDQRCLIALQNIRSESFTKSIGIVNLNYASCKSGYQQSFLNFTSNTGLVIGENAISMIDVIDELNSALEEIENFQSKNIFMEVSSMSHELVTTLIGFFSQLGLLKQITFLYVSAETYGDWLSKGVRQIRSVLGFSGIMYPSRKLHLIVLTGFEVERAQDVIFGYEPARLSIGKGNRNQSISTQHYNTNETTAEKLCSLINNTNQTIDDVFTFEFSCVDPVLFKNQLLAHIDQFHGDNAYNFVIAPLNNKISSVGAALAALERPELQICYAEAEEYNVQNYATSGTEVTIFNIP